jgi:high-affinity iron transporter
MNIVHASIPPLRRLLTLAVGAALAFFLALAPATAADNAAIDGPATITAVRQTWKLLDYLAVDYGGAVADGQVTDAGEFKEMNEFAETARKSVAALPPHSEQPALIKLSEDLKVAIAAHSPITDVARVAHQLADGLLAAYPVPMAPATAPAIARGALVYSQKCAICHGATGAGDGPAGLRLDPRPIAFTDHARAQERSVHSLYEVVSQGVAGTPMISFQAMLSDADRWAVAFHAAGYSYSDAQRASGEKLWTEDPAMRARIPNLEALTRATEVALAVEIGADKAAALLAYLRAHPDVLNQTAGSGLALTRSQLAESQKAYEAGDFAAASARALSAYLDGFEPVEAVLRARDSALLAEMETAMAELRTRIGAHVEPAKVADQIQVLRALLDRVDVAIAPGAGDSTATFLGAFTILLREGVEALLVVVAMLAFLGKVERRDMLPYVHAGWVLALVAGVATWGVAAYVIDIKGAHRELTEGFSSLFAAVVLLGVGVWMHQKSVAGRWQTYLREKLSTALTRKSAFFLFALAFVAVYREVFETILFYIALWTRGDGAAILGGLAAGMAALAVIAAILMRTSRRLPIGQFFAWSSLLIAVLAVVLAGKGVAALQEAGVLPAAAIDGPRFEAFGVYPSSLTLAAQALVIAISVAGYWWNTRAPAKAGA